MDAQSIVIAREHGSGHHFSVAYDPSKTPRHPIVFIHGAGGGAWHWDNMMRYFASLGYVCYALDLTGHGPSTQNIRTASVYDYVRDAEHFLSVVVRLRHSASPIIVGHSMGGLVAQKLAEGEHIAAVVLVTPAPPHGVQYRAGGLLLPTFGDILRLLFDLLVLGISFSLSRKFVASIFADPKASAAVIDEVVSRQFIESLRAIKEMLLTEVVVQGGRITAPMLVVRAGKDKVIHPDVASEIAEYYDASLLSVHHLGHMCIMEAGWEATAALIENWLLTNIKP